MSLVYIIIGLTLLVIGGEYLVRSSVGLSIRFHISKMVIGLTVVSFATSLPELIVSIQAAIKGFSDIALGNVIGSNIANIGLVLGLTAMISPIAFDRHFYKLNWPVMMIFSLVLWWFLSDNILTFFEGVVLLILLIVYLIILVNHSRKESKLSNEQRMHTEIDFPEKISGIKILFWFVLGSLSLWGGSELLVKGAVDLAVSLGVTERVIAITMIAVGTSIPELAASVIAALKKESAISLGNLIGSNIFNIGSVLGLTAVIHPIIVQSQEVLTIDIFWMLSFAFILIPLALIPKKLELGRLKGSLLFLGYVFFVIAAFI